MDKWFHSQSKIFQVLLLIIPVVNWFVEVIVRWSAALRKGGVLRIVFALVVTLFGLFIGWVDAIWTALFNKLILE